MPRARFNPDTKPTSGAQLPQLECPHCGHKSIGGWLFLEQEIVSRHLFSEKLPDGSEGFLLGPIQETSGSEDSGSLQCPQCHGVWGLPDNFYDWFA